MGAPDPENPLFLGFSVLRGGLRPWSQTMVSEMARPWGRGGSGDCEISAAAHVSCHLVVFLQLLGQEIQPEIGTAEPH